MATILIVGTGGAIRGWSDALRREGHAVLVEGDPGALPNWFARAEVDVTIFNLCGAGEGAGVMIPQARTAWPESRSIAVLSSIVFRSASVYQLGFWQPDQVLVSPLQVRMLTTAVSLVLAQRAAHADTERPATPLSAIWRKTA